MRVKRYISPSLQEAMERIRVDLGKDAVILSTKRIRSGGFLGFFKKDEFEVLAAIDDVKPKDVLPKSDYLQPKLELPQTMAKVNQAQQSSERNSTETKAISMENPVETAPTTHPVQATRNEQEVLKEVKEMRALMSLLVKRSSEEQMDMPVFKDVVTRLRSQEVEEEVIAFLIEQVLQSTSASTLNESDAKMLIGNEIVALLQSRYSAPINPDARLFHIVGPTGVGKTTTIAKLAANFSLKQNRKVGLITTDTYRIAAIDQLRTYANILNIPLEVVYNANELNQAVSNLAGSDIVLMDTAGRNYRNKAYIEELSRFLDTTIPSETFLVLSMSGKYNDNLAIIRQFEGLKINKIIYTKMDETESYGSILNIAYHFPLQLSFFTNGQTVPDDLNVANPEHLKELILGGVYIGA